VKTWAVRDNIGLAFRDHRTTSSLDSGLRRNDGGGRRAAVTTVVGWGKPKAHPNVAMHIDMPTLGCAFGSPQPTPFFARHSCAGRNPVVKTWAVRDNIGLAFRDHRTMSSLDSGLRRNDER